MKKTGVVWLGHADYLDENCAAVQRAVNGTLNGVEGICSEIRRPATTEKEAVQAVRELMAGDVCGTVIVLISWVECNVVMAALKELRNRPCIFWGFPPDEAEGRKDSTGAFVSAAMFNGVLRRLNLPWPTLYAGWKDPEAKKRLSDFACAARVIDHLFYAKIGLFGYTSMSIYPGTFDHVLLRWMIGPEVEQMDTYSLIRAAEAVPEAEVDAAVERLRGLAVCRENAAPEMLRKTMALYVALRNFCREKDWQAVNVKCQYELSKEYRVVPCVALSLLAEDGICAACEGDMLCTVSMMILQQLCGDQVWYGDSLTQWDNTVQFSPCGFMPFTMAQKPVYVQKFLEHPGFTGIQVSGVMRPEKVTWMRLVEDVGRYHIVCGTGTGRETQPRGGCMPALNVELDGDLKALEKEYAGQHYAIAYGDHADRIALAAELMGIEVRRI